MNAGSTTSGVRFEWRSYNLRLRVLRQALRLWHRGEPTWYVVTLEPPVQLWRICENAEDGRSVAPTFMRTSTSLAAAKQLAEQHWAGEVQRGLHDDAFPLGPEPALDVRPKPFWRSREGSELTEF